MDLASFLRLASDDWEGPLQILGFDGLPAPVLLRDPLLWLLSMTRSNRSAILLEALVLELILL